MHSDTVLATGRVGMDRLAKRELGEVMTRSSALKAWAANSAFAPQCPVAKQVKPRTSRRPKRGGGRKRDRCNSQLFSTIQSLAKSMRRIQWLPHTHTCTHSYMHDASCTHRMVVAARRVEPAHNIDCNLVKRRRTLGQELLRLQRPPSPRATLERSARGNLLTPMPTWLS